MLVLLAACGSRQSTSPTAPEVAGRVRAVTWNLAQPAGDLLERQLDFLAGTGAEVIVLQEAYKGDIDRVRTGLSQRTARVWDVRYAPQLRRLDGNDGGGIIAASALPILESDHLLMRFPDQWTLARPALRIRITPAGSRGPVDVFTTHLAAGAEGAASRQRQVDELVRWMRTFNAPRILGGDLNADAMEPELRAADTPYGLGLASDLADVWEKLGRSGGETWRSEAPTRRIDYWFVSRAHESSLVPLDAAVLDVCTNRPACLSDHKAVLAVVGVRN
jgi:endonuclease/exonuclease/phosphatase family metal-dependent hydrolase